MFRIGRFGFVGAIVTLHLAVTLSSCSAEATDEYQYRAKLDGSGRQEEEVVGASGGILTVETKRTGGQLYARQMTNGQDLLKLIYVRNGELAACEKVQGQTPELDLFLNQYSNLTSVVQRERGATRFTDVKAEFNEPVVDWDRSWSECVRLQQAKLEQQVGRKTRRRDPVEVAVQSSRSRRGTFSLILPGTTWCGVGNASNAGDVVDGVHVETDRCCRHHDLCAYTIEGFTRKYSLFNFRFHTISHCECDDTFRRCLKMAGDENSNIVGRLFFNVLGMKCFVLEPEAVCVERTWYGKCVQYGHQPKATVRESVPY